MEEYNETRAQKTVRESPVFQEAVEFIIFCISQGKVSDDCAMKISDSIVWKVENRKQLRKRPPG